jgi:hypothetical protein
MRISHPVNISVVSRNMWIMEQRALKNVNSCLYTNVYSYLETSGGISYDPYLNVVHSFNTNCIYASLLIKMFSPS